MASNILTAKNTFEEGMILDFSPDNTLSNCMTSALNATLITFNGNEMALLNDMGNARVETAYLPEGYVPVGTCEFGDIIYVVSYNPLTNKSLIGCFPSPERNISSDEVSDLVLSISNTDFIKNDKVEKVTVKKILYEKNINPGDKFIIYSDNLDNNKDKLSDYGNTDNIHGYWPKLTKIHVVAIEDSGKMIYLDSSLKWYKNDYYLNKLEETEGEVDLDEYRGLVSSAYSIFQSKVSGKLALLVELERINSFSNTHSIYTDKKDGNTTYNIFFNISWTTDHNDINPSAIKITKSEWASGKESEIIRTWVKNDEETNLNGTAPAILPVPKEGITCDINRTYKLEVPSSDYSTYLTESYNYKITEAIKIGSEEINSILVKYAEGKTYPVTDNKEREYWINVSKSIKNESGKLIYKTVNKDGTESNAISKTLKDDVINNYFHKAVPKFIASPIYPSYYITESKEEINNDLSKLVWNYTVAPVMPYGILDYLGIDGTIDFSKINTGILNLTGWRYYNSGITSTLTLDIESYPKENGGIAEVVLEFFDNQGKAAAYHITNKESFSGTFTEYIVLNSKGSNYKLNNIGADDIPFTHIGLEDPKGSLENGGKHYLDDAGTIYANALYKVLITIKYCNKDGLGNYDLSDKSMFKYYTRWYYTTSLFNENYFDTKDFDILIPLLAFDCSAEFSNNGLEPKIVSYNVENNLLKEESKPYNTIGANIYHLNLDRSVDDTGNIKLKINSGLEEDYGVFALDESEVSKIPINIILGNSSITFPQPRQLSESLAVTLPYILPVIAKKLNELTEIRNESGYIDVNYGPNNYQLSKTVSKLLEISEQTGDEIYAKEESYKSYADSFCINFVNDGNLGSEEIQYLSSIDGSTIKLEKNKYVYNSSNAYNLYETGINLTLTGIFFSKFMFSNVEKTKIKKINSVLNANPLEKIGMALHENTTTKDKHLYFNEVLGFGVGEHGGDKGRWDGNYLKGTIGTPKTWTGKSVISKNYIYKEDWHPTIDDEEVLKLFKGVLNYLVPVSLGTSNNGVDWLVVSRDCLRSIRDYIPLDSSTRDLLYADNEGGKGQLPSSDLSNANGATHIITTLCFRDLDGLVKFTDDYFVSTIDNQGFKTNLAFDDYKIKLGLSLADLLGGLYSLLYFSIGQIDSYLRKNFTYLEQFKEIWNKDFIILFLLKDTDKNNPKGLNFLLFHGFKFQEYVNAVNSEIAEDENISKALGSNNNIKFILNDISKTIQFQYEVMYDVTDIKIMFSLIENKIILMTVYNETGEDISKLVEGDVQENTLYTVIDNKLLKFSNSSILYNIDTWKGTDTKLIPVYLDSILETNNSALSKFFSIEGGTLKISGIENLPKHSNTYELKWLGGGDDPSLKEISGGSIFNKLSI